MHSAKAAEMNRLRILKVLGCAMLDVQSSRDVNELNLL